jgi:hypothetical protein
MVLAYWDIEREQAELARQLQMIPKAGTPGSRVRRLASATLDVIYRSGQWADLTATLDQGAPPILFVHTSELPYWDRAMAHAVVLVGIEGDEAALNDPGLRQSPVRVPIGDLMLAWDEMSNLYVLLKKR